MTSLAAEGVFGTMETNGFVEDDAELFAKKAVILYSDKDLWKEKQQHGFKALNTRFDKANFHELLFNTFNDTVLKLKEHRHKNFTGQMLHHHALQSTKYMSKWIEAKNK
jgi:hypothetical protein